MLHLPKMLKELYSHRHELESGLFPGSELRFVNWYLMHGCDLACHYCKVPQQRVSVMDREQRVEALNRIRTLSVEKPIISLLGGEPTLRPDFLVQAVEDASSAGFLVNLVSNGWGLTPELIRRLGQAQLHYLGISVDCDEGAEKANLQRALELHAVTKQQGIVPVINTVITADTKVGAFKSFAETVISEKILISPLACSPEVPGGVFSSASSRSVPTSEQLREIVPWLAWKKLKTGYVTASFGYLWTLFRLDNGTGSELWHCSPSFREASGSSGRGFITMDSDGFIGACQEFPRLINPLEVPPDQLSLRLLDPLFAVTTEKCPGCLHNCYVMEETIRGPKALMEIPTLLRMANIKGKVQIRQA